MSKRWVVALTTVICCCLFAAPSHAQGEGPDPNGPVFLIISLEDDFDPPVLCGECEEEDVTGEGSQTLMLPVGTIIAGPSPAEAIRASVRKPGYPTSGARNAPLHPA